MDNTTPKVSFIPKGSLVREESFLERRRPRSVMEFTAATIFFLSVSTYAGISYYNNSLNTIIAEKTIEIKKAQKEFSDAPEVGAAKVFRTRAELARDLLDAHTVVSPILSFLSQSTIESVSYSTFTFKKDTDGSILELVGEAPTYAALAFQADLFRTKKKELTRFEVRDVTLTKFGTVNFTFSMTFAPEFLLYVKNISTSEVSMAPVPVTSSFGSPSGISNGKEAVGVTPIGVSPELVPVATTTSASSSPAMASSTATSTDGWTIPLQAATSTQGGTEKPSFWSKFKFW